MSLSESCPCGSNSPFDECCGPIIDGSHLAETPQALMRSRYSAYAKGNYSYIIATYSSESRPVLSPEQLAADNAGTEWLSLHVFSSTTEGERGTVDFTAIYRHQGQFYQLSEHSRFIRKDQWLYVDGDIADSSGRIKPSRNEACVCGSGKKFKRCCGQ